MNCQFLCATHRDQLNERLDVTAPIWASWMRQGERAHNAADNELSVQYFGCAYDLALMLVDRFTAHAEQGGQRHIERLLHAGTRLAQSLAQCGHLALRREYLNTIRQILYREQLRMPLLADQLPALDDSQPLTLDAYSRSMRHRAGAARHRLN